MIKIVPKQTNVRGIIAPISRMTISPPIAGDVHPGTCIKGECALLTMHTPYGARHQGVKRGWITASLDMAVELWSDRDEVLARWPKYSPKKHGPIPAV